MIRKPYYLLEIPITWFLSSPFIIRVPFFLVFGFSKGGPTIKRAKGYHSGT